MGEEARRVIIDGSMARGGGGFTYLVNVAHRLAAHSPRDRFRLYLRSQLLADSIAPAPNLEIVKLPETGLAGRLRFTYVDAPRLAARWGANLYYSAGEYAPVSAPCPTVAAFRNPNIFCADAEDWPLRQRVRLRALRALAKASAIACDRILFVSEDSARWIGERVGLPEHKRAVVHHGIDLERWRPEPGASRHARPYVLSVSSVYRYKNYVRLIEAWAALAARRPATPDLVIIGDDQDPDYSQRMQRARAACGALSARIHLLGEVPYAEVRRWYAGAELFVFPSYLETFGHPLLEAMACELPVVAADIPVFREIARDAAFFADPHRPEALSRAMEEALYAPGARDTLVKRSRARVKELTWDHTVRGLLDLFESVAAPRALARPVRRRPAQALGWTWPGGERPLAHHFGARSQRHSASR